MRTVSAHRRKGVARAILSHIMEEAKRRSYRRLSLETGAQKAFEPVQRLYASFGFAYCPPFGDYIEDPTASSWRAPSRSIPQVFASGLVDAADREA